jgi:hypothetical protein
MRRMMIAVVMLVAVCLLAADQASAGRRHRSRCRHESCCVSSGCNACNSCCQPSVHHDGMHHQKPTMAPEVPKAPPPGATK